MTDSGKVVVFVKTNDIVYNLLNAGLKKPIEVDVALNLQEVLDLVRKRCPYFEEFTWKNLTIKKTI